ncbi:MULTISPECIES: I78 family peptidase inhibitor [unclassified Kitasatospora]
MSGSDADSDAGSDAAGSGVGAGPGAGSGSGEVGPDGEGYAGLRIERARELARRHGWASVRVLEPGDLMTMEYRHGRLNLAVRDGVVERSWEG